MLNGLFRILMPCLIVLMAGCTLDFDRFAEPIDPIEDMGTADADMDPRMLADLGEPDAAEPDALVIEDADEDGVVDADDNCVDVANPGQEDADADEIGDVCDDDADGDGVLDEKDICPGLANPEQLDQDEDGIGDACDDDIDGDQLTNDEEEGLGTDPSEPDTDFDGKLDAVDLCPVTADRHGSDSDSDGFGDACDQDDDDDGVFDWEDNCPGTANPEQFNAENAQDGRGDACIGDLDGDGVTDDVDNCQHVGNPDQAQNPCTIRFVSQTYIQGIDDLATDVDEMILAATAGGVIAFSGFVNEGADFLAGGPSLVVHSNGLSSLNIKSVHWEPRDPDVRVLRAWATTEKGLAIIRSDGFVFNFHSTDLQAGPVGRTTTVLTGQGSVWVGSDLGLNRLSNGEWSLLGPDAIGDGEVRAMWLDELDRLWVVTSSGLARIVDGEPELQFQGLPAELGEFLNIAPTASGQVMLMAEQGFVLIEDDLVAPGGVYEGFRAQAMANNGNDAYIASSTGLRRLDETGRIYPAGTLPFPSENLTAAVEGDDGPIWIGTPRGLARVNGYFATYGTPSVPVCVNTAHRIGDNIWYGGGSCLDEDCLELEPGLFISGTDNVSTRVEDALLPAGDGEPTDRIINSILSVGPDQVWVATNSGIAILNPLGELVSTLADEPFAVGVTDMIQIDTGEVWVGTRGAGLVEVDPSDLSFETITEDPDNQTLLSNFVNALAFGQGQLWIASIEGISILVTADKTFQAPLTQARLPDINVSDLVFGGGHFHAATARGLVSCEPDGVCRTVNRAGIRPALPGIPHAAGTDEVRSLTFDGEHLWLAMGIERLQPFGSLVRRSPDPNDSSGVLLFDSETHDLPRTNAFGGVKIDFLGDELYVNMCGDDSQPGGLSILAARNVVSTNPGLIGLRGDGQSAVLTTDVDGNALVGGLSEGNSSAQVIDRDDQLTDFELPPVFSSPVTRCARSPSPVTTKLWCIFGTEGFATRQLNNPWIPTASMNLRYLRDRELMDIIVIDDGEAWMATSNGLVRFSGANSDLFKSDSPGGGPGSNFVRRLHLAGTQLYVATDTSADVVDLTRLIAGEEMAWRTLDLDGRAGPVNVIRSEVERPTWLGFNSGLTVLSADGTQRVHFRNTEGLPSNRIHDVYAEDDRVFVATEGGLGVLEFACANGLDDDRDGLIDLSDDGCIDGLDPSERGGADPAAQCSNGVDDDADGIVDFPDEPGCSSAGDDDEADPAPDATAACGNGVDDDEDGLTDYPEDEGCAGLGALAEEAPSLWNLPHRFTPLGLNEGLPGTAVYEIHRATAGEVWVRSDNGVARFLFGGPAPEAE